MVSAKLVHQIEDHWEDVSRRFLRLQRSSPELPHIAQLTESELNETCRRILRNLGNWLVCGSESDIAWHYERIGGERKRMGIPLSEAIRALQLMKDATLDFIQDAGTIESSVDLYAEEELERNLGRFFDLLMYHLARGYESATAAAEKAAARAATIGSGR